MKKVLYITTVSRTINAFLIPHIEMLVAQGYQVDCACNIDQEVEGSLITKDVKIHEVTFTRNPFHLRNLRAYQTLLQLQKANEYDIIHVHTPIAALYGRLIKAKYPQVKTIYTVHGFHFYKGAPWINWALYYPIEKMMARFTDSMITMNNEDYERSLTFSSNAHYFVNGVGVQLETHKEGNKEEIRRRLGLSTKDFVLVMIAEVNKNKNHQQLIEAVEELKKQKITIKVLCAGDGPYLKRIKEEINKRNLQSSIYMLGYRNDVQQLITAADAGVLLSYREGLPRNIMELMAAGKPVIGTNIRGIRDLVKDGETGFLVDVKDSKTTAKRIKELLQNQTLQQQFSTKAKEKIQSYHVNKINDVLKQIYESTG